MRAKKECREGFGCNGRLLANRIATVKHRMILAYFRPGQLKKRECPVPRRQTSGHRDTKFEPATIDSCKRANRLALDYFELLSTTLRFATQNQPSTLTVDLVS